jgi:hypothetical protein
MYKILLIIIIVLFILNIIYILINYKGKLSESIINDNNINLYKTELMSTRLEKYDVYDKSKLSGLALKCDWFIHTNNILNITNTEKPKLIFISNYIGNITIPYFVNNILPNITWNIKIIIASEDFTFPEGDKDDRLNYFNDKKDIVNNLINNKYVKYIFVENLDTLNPKLVPIPLGILHNMKVDYNLFMDQKDLTLRDIKVFCCHRIREDGSKQWDKRKEVTKLCLSEWKDIVYYKDVMDENEFKNTLLNSQFVICVNGGGIDPSPRVWQALLCGCIPIIQKSTLDEAYSRFPLVYIDEWNKDAITTEKLNIWLDKYKSFYIDKNKRKEVLIMLTLDYWWNIIINK